MNSRHQSMIFLAVAGTLTGAIAQYHFLPADPKLGWYAYALIVIGTTIGTPMVLGSIGTNRDYKTVARSWSFLGGLAFLLLFSGTSAAALSMMTKSSSGLPLLAMSFGAGLFAGLGVVKLAIARSRSDRLA